MNKEKAIDAAKYCTYRSLAAVFAGSNYAFEKLSAWTDKADNYFLSKSAFAKRDLNMHKEKSDE